MVVGGHQLFLSVQYKHYNRNVCGNSTEYILFGYAYAQSNHILKEEQGCDGTSCCWVSGPMFLRDIGI